MYGRYTDKSDAVLRREMYGEYAKAVVSFSLGEEMKEPAERHRAKALEIWKQLQQHTDEDVQLRCELEKYIDIP